MALSLNAVSAEETSDATVIEDLQDSSIDSIDSIGTTSNSNNLTTVLSYNANVDISQDVKSSDYNIDENINDKNLENSYDDLKEVADKNKNVIGASVDDKEILGAADGAYCQLRDSASQSTSTISTFKSGQTVSLDWYWASMGGTTWTLYVNGAATSTKVSSANYDSGGSWIIKGINYTFTQARTYTLQLRYSSTYSGESYNSNTMTYVVGENSVPTELTIGNTANLDVKKFVYPDSSSVTVTIQDILSSSEKTASELSSLVGSGSTITWYLDGSSAGTSSIGYTGSPTTKQFTLTTGEHTLYAAYAGKTTVNAATSNKLKFFVGVIPEEYNITLTLADKHLTPNSNGVFYVPIGSFANLTANVFNDTLGANIENYIETETHGNNVDVLDTAKLYLWNWYAHDLEIYPQGAWNVSLAMYMYEAEIIDAYLVFEGNDLGLLPAMSNHLKYVVYTNTNTTVAVTPGNYWAKGGKLVITPTVQYQFANTSSGKYENFTVTDGNVDIYVNNAKVATVKAGESYIYTVPSSASSLSFEARYLGYNVTVNGANYQLYKPSTGTESGSTDGSLSNSMTLRVNGSTEKSGAPGAVFNLVSSASNYYSYGSNDLHIYVDGQLYDTGNYYYTYGGTVVRNYNITFDESQIGDHVIFTVYDGYYYYDGSSSNKAGAVSNNVTIHVTAPQRTTTTTVTATPAESNIGDIVTITPTVNYGSTAITNGTVAIYIDETFMAYVNPGQKYTYVSSESGTYAVRAEYLGNTFGGYTYKGSNGTTNFVVNAVSSKTPTTLSLTIQGNSSEAYILATDLATIKNTISPSVPSSRVRILYNGTDSGMNAFYTNNQMQRSFDVGVYNVTLFYPGDDNYESSTSNSVILHVIPVTRATTTTVTATPSPADVGDTITITPSVKYGSSSSVTWGTVEIYVNNAKIGEVNLASQTSLTVSASVVGTNNVTAKYLQNIRYDYNYTESQGTTTFAVNNNEVANTTTVSVVNPGRNNSTATAATSTTICSGDYVTLIPNLDPNDGNVKYLIKQDGTTISNAVLSNGYYSLSLTNTGTSPVTYTFTVEFEGNITHAASGPATVTVTVLPDIPTVIDLENNTEYIIAGGIINLIVNVNETAKNTQMSSNQGSIKIYLDGSTTPLATISPENTYAYVSDASISAGSHYLSFEYSGFNGTDARYLASNKRFDFTVLTGKPAVLTVNGTNEFVARVGSTVHFVSVCDQNNGNGNVFCNNNSSAIGSIQANKKPLDYKGTVPGTFVYHAEHNGGVESNDVIVHWVNAIYQTTTDITINPDPGVVGETVAISVNVKDNTNNADVPAGDIIVYFEEVQKGTISNNGNINSDTLSTVKEYVVYAKYQGTIYNYEYYNLSEDTYRFTAQEIKSTTVSISADDSDIKIGESTTVRPIVKSGDVQINEGDVEIYINGNAVANITAGQSFAFDNTIYGDVGEYNVSAKYLGFGSYLGSESLNVSVNVNKIPTSISLTVNNGDSATINSGSGVTFRNTIAPSAVNKPNVRLFYNGTEQSINAFHANEASGLTIYFYEPGVYKVTAYYPGNGTYEESSYSNEVTVTVNPISRSTSTTVTANSPVNIGDTVSISPEVKYGNTVVDFGIVEIYLNGNPIKNITAGETWDVSASVIGTNNLTAKYLGMVKETSGKYYNYTESQGSSTFIVRESLYPEISLSPSSSTILVDESQVIVSSVTVNGNSITDGDVEIYVNGNPVANITAGSSFTLDSTFTAIAGEYDISAKYWGYTGDAVVYSECETRDDVKVNVVKNDVDIQIDIGETTYPSMPSAIITVNVTGTYNVKFGSDDTQTLSLSAGDNTVYASKILDAHDGYVLTVEFEANRTHNDNSKSVNFNVKKGNLVLDLNVDPSEITYGDDPGLISLKTNLVGTYTVVLKKEGEDSEITHYDMAITSAGTAGNRFRILMAPVSGGDAATQSIGTLDAGDYVLSVDVEESANYGEAHASATYTVNQNTPEFSISANADNTTVNPLLNDENGDEITADMTDGSITYLIDGEAQDPVAVGTPLDISDLNPGDHTIGAVYSGDTNYGESSADDIVVNIPFVGTEIVIDVPPSYSIYVDDYEHYINLALKDIHGNILDNKDLDVVIYNVYNPGNKLSTTVHITDGKASVDDFAWFFGYGFGKYNITAKFESDGYYDDSESSELFVIYEQVVEFSSVTYDDERVYGEEIPITYLVYVADENYLLNPYNGEAQIVLVNVDDLGPDYLDGFDINDYDGIVYNVTTVDGDGSLTLVSSQYPDKYAVGEYYVGILVEGVWNWGGLNVVKADPELNLSAQNITYGQNVTLKSTIVPDDVTGDVKYYLDGNYLKTLTIDDGTLEDIDIPNLSVGNHTVSARYGGDGNYTGAEPFIIVEVRRADVNIQIADVTVTYPNAGVIGITANVSGNYTVSINNKRYSVEIIVADGASSGQGSLNVDTLDANTYPYTVSISQSQNYNGASESANYIVKKAESELTIVGEETLSYGEAQNIMPTLTDGATGTITYTLKDSEGNIIGTPTTIAVGANYTKDSLDVGTYTVAAHYNGDDNHEESDSNEFRFEVIPILDLEITANAIPVDPDYGSSVTYTITVTNNGPKDATGVKVRGIDSSKWNSYTAKVDGEDVSIAGGIWDIGELENTGSVTLVILANIGTLETISHSFQVESAEDDSNNLNNIATTVVNANAIGSEVSASPVIMTYADDAQMFVSIENASGIHYTIISAGVVIAEGDIGADAENENQVTIDLNTVNDGGDLNAGTYTVRLETIVDGNHISSEYLTGITVNKAGSSVNADSKEIYAGNPVTIAVSSINATSVNYVVMKAGVAVDGASGTVAANGSFTLDNLPAGTYSVSLVTVTDENHDSVENITGIVVLKHSSHVEAESVAVEYGNPVAITVKSENATGVTYVVMKAGVAVDGASGTVAANGSFTLNDLAAGTYTVVLTTIVNGDMYDSVINETGITVTKAPSSVNASSKTVDYGESVSVEIISENATAVDWVLMNAGVAVDGASGTIVTNGTIDLGVLAVGTYTLRLSTVTDDNHSSVYNESGIVVRAVQSTVISNSTVVNYGDHAVLTVNFTNADSVNYVVMQAGQAIEGKSGVINQDTDDLDLGILAVGTYTVRFTTNVADGYNSAEFESGVIVRAVASIVNASANSITYGEDPVIITIEFANASSVNYEVVRGGVVVDDENATGSITVSGSVVELYGLDAGRYAVRLTTVTDGNYSVATGSASFSVNPAPTKIEVQDDSLIYGDRDVQLNLVFYNASKVYYVIESAGQEIRTGSRTENGTFDISGLDAGTYTVEWYTEDDDNLIQSIEHSGIVISKAQSSVSADSIAKYYGDEISIEFSSANATGGVRYYLMNAGQAIQSGTIDANDIGADGVGTIVFGEKTVPAGEYTLRLETVTDKNHEMAESRSAVIVLHSGAHVNASNIIKAYGEEIDIDVESENATAGIKYYVMNAGKAVKEGTIPASAITGGKSTIHFDAKEIPVGEYTLLLVTQSYGNYTSVENRSALVIVQADASVNASDITEMYGEDISIAIDSQNATSGIKYYVIRAGTTVKEGTIAVGDIAADGKTTLEFAAKELSVGEYTLLLVTQSLGNYTSAESRSAIVITQAKSSVSADDISKVYGEEIDIEFESENATAGVKYSVIKAGKVVKEGTIPVSEMTDGKGTISLAAKELPVGEYTLLLVTQSLGNYTSAESRSAIIVTQAASSVNASSVTKYYGEEITVAIDSQNATGGIKYSVIKAGEIVKEGLIPVSDIGDDGKAALEFAAKELSVGEYTLVLETLSLGNYTSSESRSAIIVIQGNSSVSAEDIRKIYGEEITVEISSQNATAGIKYSVVRAGAVVKEGTIAVGDIGADGKSTIRFDAGELPVAEYTLVLETLSLGNYTSSESRSAIVVVPASSSVNASDVRKQYGEAITVEINSQNATAGISYSVIRAGTVVKEGTIPLSDIDAEGKAVLEFAARELSVGEYTLVLITQSYGNYTSAENRSAIIVTPVGSRVNASDITEIYGEEIRIDVESQNATAGIKYYVMNAGKAVVEGTIAAEDIDDGKATVTIPAGLSVGEYTLLLVTQNYGNYTTVENRSALIVTPAASSVTAYDLEKVYAEDIEFTVSSLNATKVNYVVLDGENIIAGATVNANGSFNVPRLNAGNYTIRFTTVTDGNHESASEDYDLNIAKAASSVSVPDASGATGTTINVLVSGENQTGFTAKVYDENGVEVIGADIDIVGSHISVSGLASGEYTLEVSTIVDETNYYSVSDNGTITIVPVADLVIDPTVNVPSGQDAEVGDELTYTIKVTNAGPNDAENVYVLISEISGELTLLTVNGSTDFESYGYDEENKIWTIGHLDANGGEAELVLVLEVESAGDIVSRFTAYPVEGDGNPADNVRVLTVGSDANADVTISASSDLEGIGYVGDKVIFEINVTNNGPSPVTNLNFTGLFDNLKYLAFESNASYSEETKKVLIGELANGESYLFHLAFEIESEGTISADLSAYADETDHVLENNHVAINKEARKRPSLVDSNASNSITYGEDSVVSISLKDHTTNDAIDDIVTVTVSKYNDGVYDEVIYTESIEVDGSVDISINEKIGKFLDAGHYLVKVEFAGNDYYYGDEDSETTFVVNQRDLEVESYVMDGYYEYHDDAVIYIGADFIGEDSTGRFVLKVYDANGANAYQTTVVLNGTVGEDSIYLHVPGLNAGNYTYTLELEESDNYNAQTVEIDEGWDEFEVGPIDSSLTIRVSDTPYHEAIVADVYLIEAGSGTPISGNVIVSIEDNDGNVHNYPVSVDDGQGQVVIDDIVLAVGGPYDISVAYEDSLNYNGDSDESNFMVTPVDAVLSVSATNVDYGESTNVTVRLTGADGNLNATVKVDINGIEHDVEVIDGEGSILVGDLDAGYLYAHAVFANNETYNDAEDYAQFNVSKVGSLLNVIIDDTYFGKDAIINVELNATNGTGLTGVVIVTIGGNDYEVGVVNGIGSNNVTGLAVGDYSANASFAGNNNYDSSVANDEFKVYGASIKVESTEDPISYGDKSNLVISLIDTETNAGIANAKVSIIIGNKEKEVTLDAEGKYEFAIEDILDMDYENGEVLNVGEYDVEVVFEDETYGALTDDASLTVVKATDATLEVSGGSFIYGEIANVTVKVTGSHGEALTGTVIIALNGTDYALSLNASGEGIVEIGGLASGTYPIAAKYLGDDNYETALNNSEGLVILRSNTAVIDVTGDNVAYNGHVIANITLVDGEGYNLTDDVQIRLAGDEDWISVPVAGGVGHYDFGSLAVGNYTIEVQFVSEDYVPSTVSDSVDVEVTKADASMVNIAVENVTISYGGVARVNIAVTGIDGVKLDGKANITVNGTTYEVNVTEGVAAAEFDGLIAGAYVSDVVFANDYYAPATGSGSVTVEKATDAVLEVSGGEFIYNSPATVSVRVIGNDEELLNGTVVVVVNGTRYAVTVIDGVGDVNITGLASGTYPIDAKYLGDDNYAGVINNSERLVILRSDIASIELSSEDVIYGNDVIANITLVDGEGYNLTATVQISINGADYIDVDVVNGVGQYNFGALDVATYTIDVKFADDAYGEDDIVDSVTVKVTGADASAVNIETEVNDPEFGENATVSIDVTGIDGAPLNGSALITVGNMSQTVTVVDGKANASFEGLDAGTYPVTVEFTSDNYEPAYDSDSLTVSKSSGAKVTVTGDEIAYGGVATVTIELTGNDDAPIGGIVIVTVDGVDYAVNVTDGSGSVDIKGLASGTYDVAAKFIGNDQYLGADANDDAKVIVNASTDAVIDIEVDEPTYGEDAIVNITVTDGEGKPVDGLVNVSVDGGEPVEVTVTNGTATVTLENLTAGEHNVTVVLDDGEHDRTEETATFNVEKQSADNVDLVVVTEDIEFGEDTSVNITVKDIDGNDLNGTAVVTVGNNDPVTVDVVDGSAVVPVAGLDVGDYPVTVVFNNDNYEPKTETASITVSKSSGAKVSVTGDEIAYGDVATVTIELTGNNDAPIGGIVIVTVDGVDYAVNVTDGSGSVDIKGLASGTYDVAAKFIGNDDYEAVDANDDAKVIVNASTDAVVDVAVDDIAYGEDAIVNITVTDGEGKPVDGVVNVSVDGGEPVEVTVTNGTAAVTLENLTAGEHNVTVVLDDGEHDRTEETATFNVEKQSADNVNIETAVNEPEFGENATVSIDVTGIDDAPLNGTAVITVGNMSQTVTVVDGKANASFEGLDAGTYPVTVEFTNDNYEPAYDSDSLTVSKSSGAKVTVTGDEIAYGDVATVTVELTGNDNAPIDGMVVVTVDGVDYAVNVTDGSGSVDIKGLASGTYDVAAKFIGNDQYSGADANDDAKVIVNASTDAVVDVAVDDIAYGEDATVNITVTDGEGKPVDGVVNVSVDGGDPVEVTVTNGTATVTLENLTAGEHNVTVVLDDGEHDRVEQNATVTVDKQSVDNVDLVVDTEDIEFGEDTSVNITVKDIDGNDLNGTAVVTVGNNDPVTVDVVDGSAVVPVAGLDVGDYPVTVVFNNDNYEPKTETASITVSKSSGAKVTVTGDEIAYGDVATVTVELTGNDDVPIDGIVIVSVDGVDYAVNVTGGSGSVEIKGLASGTYDVAAKFIGNDDYEAADANDDAKVIVNASTDAVIDIEVDEPSYGENATVNITVTDGEGKPITSNVTVIIDGENSTVEVINGSASVPVENLTAGDHNVTVILDDGEHDRVEQNATVTVDKQSVDNVDLVVDTEDIEFGEDTSVNITVKDIDGNDLNGTAVVTVGNNDPVTVDVVDGSAVVPVAGLDVGDYPVTVVFNNDNYEPKTETASITVSKSSGAKVTVTGDEIAYGDVATVTIELTGNDDAPIDGIVIVSVDGVEYAVNVTGGSGSADIKGLASGTYDVVAKFIGNDDYEAADANDDVKILVNASTDATVDVVVDEPTYGENATVNITVTDGEGKPVDGNVTIIIDGENRTVEVINGSASVPVENLTAGDHNITVVLDDGEHDKTEINTTITVDPAKDANMTVTVNDPDYGENATVDIEVLDADGKPLNGTVDISVDGGEPITVDVVDGKASVPIADLSAGNHTVEVEFTNPNYDSVAEDAIIHVGKSSNANIVVSGDEIDYGDVATVAVELTGNDGAPISGMVVVTVDGVDYAVNVTGGSGSVEIKGLASGTYDVVAKFIGNDDYESSVSNDAKVIVHDYDDDVNVNISTDDPILGYDANVNITITDGDGKPVTDNVTLIVDGNNKTIEVINGSASLALSDLDAGRHNVTVIYGGDENHAPKVINSQLYVQSPIAEYYHTDLKVSLDKDKIVYGDGNITATITLTANNKSLDGPVNVYVNGKMQTVNVTNGMATLVFADLAAGNYSIIADYLGYDKYPKASDHDKFNVLRKNTTFNFKFMDTVAINPNLDGRNGEYFYFQLVDADGNPLANKNVSIGFNGKIYNRTTNATGWSKLQINLAVSANYTFALVFLGDENYSAAFNVSLIQVLPQKPKLTTTSKTYKVNAKTKTLTVKFLTSRGNPVKGREIKFKVNGRYYIAKTQDNGVATVKVSLNKKGTYSFTATFNRDRTYDDASVSGKIVIK